MLENESNTKKMYTIFYNTPVDCADYLSIAVSNIFSNFFCATRWFEDKIVANRAVEVWSDIVKGVVNW